MVVLDLVSAKLAIQTSITWVVFAQIHYKADHASGEVWLVQ